MSADPASQPPGWSLYFHTAADIDMARSIGCAWDSAHNCATSTRSQGSTCMPGNTPEYFNALTGWTPIRSGDASVTIITDPDPDPAIGKVLDLQTGTNAGNMAGVQRVLSAIPNSFGIMVIVKLDAVGFNAANALLVQCQNNAGKNVIVRFYDSMVETFVGSAWQPLSTHGGAYWTEWWIECVDKGNGTHDVSLWAGTQVLGTVNGALPTTAGNNNLFSIVQQSAANAGRHSKVSQASVGVTQTPDHMIMCSHMVTVAQSPTTGTIRLLVENTCEMLDPNNNIRVFVTKDGALASIPWQQWTLSSLGIFGNGVLDPWKRIHELVALGSFPAGAGKNIRMYVDTSAGAFLPIKAIGMGWT